MVILKRSIRISGWMRNFQRRRSVNNSCSIRITTSSSSFCMSECHGLIGVGLVLVSIEAESLGVSKILKSERCSL